jgi:hypothetical protein
MDIDVDKGIYRKYLNTGIERRCNKKLSIAITLTTTLLSMVF